MPSKKGARRINTAAAQEGVQALPSLAVSQQRRKAWAPLASITVGVIGQGVLCLGPPRMGKGFWVLLLGSLSSWWRWNRGHHLLLCPLPCPPGLPQVEMPLTESHCCVRATSTHLQPSSPGCQGRETRSRGRQQGWHTQDIGAKCQRWNWLDHWWGPQLLALHWPSPGELGLPGLQPFPAKG